MIRHFIIFYLLLTSCVAVYSLAEPYVREGLIRDLFVEEYSELNEGLFYLLDAHYERGGEEEFLKIWQDLPSNTVQPFTLFRMDEPGLPDAVMQGLEQNDVYVDDILDIVLYSKVADSPYVVMIGPEGITPKLENARLTYQFLLYAILALPVFFWVYNLYGKVQKLETATSHFGRGNFSVRVSEQTKHRVGQLNKTFNQMAERVERLINGHKSLTNAVAHELRTPVSRVRFQLDMLYQEGNETQRKEYMHGISDDVMELGDMIDELLTYARFDREPVAPSMHSHSLHESIQNVIGTRHFNSELIVSYDDSWFLAEQSLQYMNFDPKHLERAIGNLVANAEKYSQTRINIYVKRTTEDCQIIVDDDGPGIPPERRVDIFEPFKRLDDSRTRSTGGYGLGLSIVHQIAQWHRGSISIGESPVGGARFVFRWPING